MTSTQVLIAGAGPTGLVLALWLTRMGISVRIIDKLEAPSTTTRAIVMQARNLEFYHQLGISHLAIRKGVAFNAVNLWAHGKKMGHLSLGDIGKNVSPYPYVLIFPQDAQEQLLTAQLAKAGVTVDRGTELVSYLQTDKGVTAKLHKAGKTETCKALYLAGCDGAHSVVRKQMGVTFPGGEYERIFYVADVTCTGPIANGEMHGAFDKADFLIIFPMKGKGNVRLVGTIKQGQEQTEELKWEDVSQDIFDRTSIEVQAVNWFSTYKVHHRVASHFRDNKVFLLGDAGHIHSPVGGQGMNTGIGDAVNLAWKLRDVITGAAPEPLLDTYETERIPFANKLVQTTDKAFRFVSSTGAVAQQVRQRVVPNMVPMLFRAASVRNLLFRTVSQTAINYPDSALSIGKAGEIKGGDRLPWVKFASAGAHKKDNFESLKTLRWQVHCYGKTTDEIKELCAEKHVKLHVFPHNAMAKKAGIKPNALYVVRPDGYVGMAQSFADAETLAGYLDTVSR